MSIFCLKNFMILSLASCSQNLLGQILPAQQQSQNFLLQNINYLWKVSAYVSTENSLVMSMQIFPINIKGLAGCVATLFNWLSAWVVTMSANLLLTWSPGGLPFCLPLINNAITQQKFGWWNKHLSLLLFYYY